MTPDELFTANVRHVHTLAKRMHSHELHRYGIEIEDLVQVGMVAMWRASETFDASLGFVFATHSLKRVRGAMLDLVRKVRGRWSRVALPQYRDSFDDVPSNDEANDHDIEWLRAQVETLPEPVSKIVRAKMRGETDAKIAKRIGLTEGCVLKRRGVGIRMLRERLRRQLAGVA